MAEVPRCHARTRSGATSRSAAVRGKRVCRMHGGAKGAGAPSGPANGMWKHGLETREAVRLRQAVSPLVRLFNQDVDS